MSTLRKLIREVILLESAKTIDDAINLGAVVTVDRSYSLGSVFIKIDPAPSGSKGLFRSPFSSGKIAMIQIGSPHTSTKFGGGSCKPKDAGGNSLPPAWEVKWSEAQKGWGPLAYDIAMEVSRLFGASLTSDRDEVSDEAQNVWRYYDRHRSDVISGQLDDEEGTLTKDPSDDCSQEMSRKTGPHPSTWASSPLSRAFTVPDGHYPKLQKLADKGALVGSAKIKDYLPKS